MKTLRVAIIGCGEIAYRKHLPGIERVPDVRIIAFCDTNIQRARALALGYEKSTVYEDYRQMLLEAKPDVVHVLTPNAYHAQISIDAMYAGCHVLCEKPMATNYRDAYRMMSVAKETGRKLTIGFQNRFREDCSYLKEMCENGELGEIYYARAFASNRRMIPSWGSFGKKSQQGGGALIDIGCHSLDLALWLMDNYQPLYVSGQTFRRLTKTADPNSNGCGAWSRDIDVEESAVGTVVMKNGAVLSIQAAWAINMIEKTGDNVVLCGTRAGADMYNSPQMGHMDGLRINLEHNGKLATLHPNFYPTANKQFMDLRDYNYQVITAAREARAFYEAIREDKPVMVLPEQACTVAMIIEGVYRSAREMRPDYFHELC